MSKKKYLAFDCETGGTDPKKHSLLEIAFVVADEKLNVIDTLELKLKDQKTNATYKITPGALACNKVDILAHNKESITYEEGKVKLLNFLTKHKETKFIPLGHNINFDLDFIYEYLLTREEFSKFVDYHVRDTGSITGFLKDKGVGLEGRKYSLANWAEFFKIDYDKEALHTAIEDVVLTIEVYKRMLGI